MCEASLLVPLRAAKFALAFAATTWVALWACVILGAGRSSRMFLSWRAAMAVRNSNLTSPSESRSCSFAPSSSDST